LKIKAIPLIYNCIGKLCGKEGYEMKKLDFNPANMDADTTYQLLTGCVMPRPIAWISTRSADGLLNLAPFSFFNIASSDPPILAISISEPDDASKGKKDTLRNIEETGELVVNVVSEELVDQMNSTGAEFPYGVNEFDVAGLHTEESLSVSVPRIAEAKASLECKLRQIIPIGADHLVLAEVVRFVVREDVVADGKIQPEKMKVVGRMAGPRFTKTNEIFMRQIPSVSDFE
jgi:flavin reductase (DIM6/NTAB) family NADH-FMN oxidoreductase RutF